MRDFVVKEILNTDLESEIRAVGFDKSYAGVAKNKYEFKNLKVFDLTPAQANILKQTALSFGADCATHRETITCKVEKTDCILGGSISTLKKVANNLEGQPFGLNSLKEAILSQLEQKLHKTKLVGILNLTTNSFSDGGLYYDFDSACAKFLSLIEDGADMIDVGAESTKLGAHAVGAKEQLDRLLPVLEFAVSQNVAVSVDTRSAEVAQEVLRIGKFVINDVSGLEYDPKMADVIVKQGATVVLQHSKDMKNSENIVDDVFLDLRKRIILAREKGIEEIIADIGIGFGKTREQNLELIRRVGDFKSLDCPLMLGVSRKSFLGVEGNDNGLKDALSLAFNVGAINAGVDYLRVHNVKLHKAYLDTYRVNCPRNSRDKEREREF